tara:strand:+ start:195 stop:410 length:216 start_codon:yes stop_codon:yes gene_type:complete
VTKLDEYRENITLHLVRITGDLEYLKEKVDKCENHLDTINGRVRKTEKQVYWIFGVGAAVSSVLSYLIYFN